MPPSISVALTVTPHIALKKPEASDRISMLKDLYDEAFQLAADEDRDRASVRFIPFTDYGF